VASHGLSKLEMGDVSECAGLSPGTLYRYFSNRDELLAALSVRAADHGSGPEPRRRSGRSLRSDLHREPHPVYREVHRRCPVARSSLRDNAILTRHEYVLYALRHPEYFSSGTEAAIPGNDEPPIPLQIDPPDPIFPLSCPRS